MTGWKKRRNIGLWWLRWATELALFELHIMYDKQTSVYYTTVGRILWELQWNVLLFNIILSGKE